MTYRVANQIDALERRLRQRHAAWLTACDDTTTAAAARADAIRDLISAGVSLRKIAAVIGVRHTAILATLSYHPPKPANADEEEAPR